MTGFNHLFFRRNSLWWYSLETISQKEQMNRVRERGNFSSEDKKKIKKSKPKMWKAGGGQKHELKT